MYIQQKSVNVHFILFLFSFEHRDRGAVSYELSRMYFVSEHQSSHEYFGTVPITDAYFFCTTRFRTIPVLIHSPGQTRINKGGRSTQPNL